MVIRCAAPEDFGFLKDRDSHLSEELLAAKIGRNEILLLCLEGRIRGWLRFNYFWDEIPFMNMLVIDQELRGKGYGRALVETWEESMREAGFEQVFTSTLADESAQHFYRKLGYRDIGSFILPGEAAELILRKEL